MSTLADAIEHDILRDRPATPEAQTCFTCEKSDVNDNGLGWLGCPVLPRLLAHHRRQRPAQKAGIRQARGRTYAKGDGEKAVQGLPPQNDRRKR
jgi:hypothetical protein